VAAAPADPELADSVSADSELPAESELAADSNVGVDDIGSAVESLAGASLLDEDPDASWYVRPPSGGQYGPATGEILKQWIDEGRVATTALLWREGWPQWRDAREALPELAARLPVGGVASRGQRQDAPAKSRPQPVDTSTTLSGQTTVGTQRRARSSRRVVLIGVLTAVAVALIGILVIVLSSGGDG
jgi:hypothetical protein